MIKKILISTENNAQRQFVADVQATCEAANSLINLFNTFQPWTTISTIEQFEELVSNPQKYFDNTITVNVHVTARGLTVDPGQAAKLFNINRDEFLNLCAGLPIEMESCKPCQQVRIKPGKQAVSKREFVAVKEYLNFTAGLFEVDQEAVENSLDRFNVYAETEGQIAVYNRFTGLVDLLNEHTAKYPINSNDRMTIARAFHLQLTRGSEGDFRLNDEYLKNEIIYIKTKS